MQNPAKLSILTEKQLPTNVLNAKYAVRGEVVDLAQKIKKELQDNPYHTYPFDNLITCNIGNPLELGQTAITFHRQVLSLLLNPKMLTAEVFPNDILKRVSEYIGGNTGGLGAYSHTKGALAYRQKVVDYINRRDQLDKEFNADPNDIFMSDGASPSVKVILELLINNKNDVILIPIPQYPLYSASVTRLGGTWTGYELKEDYEQENPCWGLDVQLVEDLIIDAHSKGQTVRGIVVINPGNPTGNIFEEAEIHEIVKLAEKYGMVILADEVYQENIYSPTKKFVSFRKVVHKNASKVQLFSFHSISKGYYGECGLRGGYAHLDNIDSGVNDQIYKLFTMNLCSNTVGQAMVASILNPPQYGEESYDVFAEEKDAILSSLKEKANLVCKGLNEIEGIKCMPIEGAMYAFPKINLPKKYIEYAKSNGKQPDIMYCIEVLKSLGVILVQGSGFAQRPGTYHFRMTILPEKSDLESFLKGLKDFQSKLYLKYGNPVSNKN